MDTERDEPRTGSSSSAESLPRLLQVMWGREQTARRGPKPGLTLDRIAAAGVTIADTEGLGAVSMSRVAKELGFTTMSLYRYVNSKDDLEMAMLDSAYGAPYTPWTPDAGDSDLGWRTRLHAWADAIRGALLKHPWILQITIKEPPLGPHQIGWMEVGLAAMAGTPLTGQAKLSSILLVDVYTRGQTELALGLMGSDGTAADQLYGLRLMQLTDDERFPHLRAAVMSGGLDDEGGDFGDEEFAFGLRTVLDGIQVNIDRNR